MENDRHKKLHNIKNLQFQTYLDISCLVVLDPKDSDDKDHTMLDLCMLQS